VVAAARVEEAATSMVDEMAELEELALFRNKVGSLCARPPYETSLERIRWPPEMKEPTWPRGHVGSGVTLYG